MNFKSIIRISKFYKIIFAIIFCFSLFSNHVNGQTSQSYVFTTEVNISDKEWLNFVKHYGLSNGGGILEKLPVIKSELNLTQDETNDIEELISSITHLNQINKNIGGEENVGERTEGKFTPNTERINTLKNQLNDAESKSIEQVKVVRNMLGKKDLDFRFWLFEDTVISSAEFMARWKKTYQSAEQLSQDIADQIEKTDQYKSFSNAKVNEFGSESNAKEYFLKRREVLKKRVELQIAMDLSSVVMKSSTQDSFNKRKQLMSEISILSAGLN